MTLNERGEVGKEGGGKREGEEGGRENVSILDHSAVRKRA